MTHVEALCSEYELAKRRIGHETGTEDTSCLNKLLPYTEYQQKTDDILNLGNNMNSI